MHATETKDRWQTNSVSTVRCFQSVDIQQSSVPGMHFVLWDPITVCICTVSDLIPWAQSARKSVGVYAYGCVYTGPSAAVSFAHTLCAFQRSVHIMHMSTPESLEWHAMLFQLNISSGFSAQKHAAAYTGSLYSVNRVRGC